MISITGLGLYLPRQIVTNDEWPTQFGKHAQGGDRTLNDIEPSTDPESAAILERDLKLEENDPFLGSKLRHRAFENELAADCAANAAREAVLDANIDVSDIDTILTYAVVPDRVSMQDGAVIAKMLGISENVMYTIVDNTCASVSTQLAHAVGLISSGQAKNVLCTQTSIWCKTFPMTHPASPGVGDAATAFIVSWGEGLQILSNHGVGHPEHLDSVAWVRGRSGDEAIKDDPWHKAGPDFRMGSLWTPGVKLLMRETVSFGANTIKSAAEKARIDVSKIDVLASVQPRGFIPGAIAERLGLSRDVAITTYDKIAHVGACGLIANLLEARKRDMIKNDSVVALYGQGFGFTRTASILKMSR